MEKPQILVVDDEDSVRELIVCGLGEAYEIHEANDGLDAMEKIAKLDTLQMVFTDNHMPRMTGIELCTWLKTSKNKAKRVLASGGLDEEKDAALLLPAALHLFLPKPLIIVKMRKQIADLLAAKE